MADKKISELTLIDEASDDVNIPGHDGIQTYRMTVAQLKAFLLADQAVLLAMLKNDIFNGLSAVTPAADDYFTLVDTSDSNKTKKALVGSFQTPTISSKTSSDNGNALSYNDDLVLVNTGTAFGMTMFASSAGGKPIRIQKTSLDFNAFTLTRAGSDVFREMGSTSTTLTLNYPGEEVTLVLTAANNFEVIRRNPNGGVGKKLGFDHSIGSSNTAGANHLHVMPVRATKDCIITKMSLYMADTGSAGSKVALGIYDSPSGLPVNKLGQTAEKTRTTTDVGLFYMDMLTPVKLVAGTEYFFAMHSGSACAYEIACNNVGSGKQKYFNITYNATLPATLSTPTGDSSGLPSIAAY